MHYNLLLFIGETKKVKFQYRPAKNYPLDLYYLMDLTWSMKDDKKTLVSLRDDLPEMLKNLTDNFRLVIIYIISYFKLNDHNCLEYFFTHPVICYDENSYRRGRLLEG